MVLAFGIWCGVSGLEHGLFEVMQGSTAPEIHLVSGHPMIHAIGEANRFWEYGVEYAYTVIPNFLGTGILAMVSGLFVVIWSAAFVQKRFGWLVFMVASIAQCMVGGGAAQVGGAVMTGLLGACIDRPLPWWRIVPCAVRRVLAAPWLGLLIALLCDASAGLRRRAWRLSLDACR